MDESDRLRECDEVDLDLLREHGFLPNNEELKSKGNDEEVELPDPPKLKQEFTGALLPNGMKHGKGNLVYENRLFRFVGSFEHGKKHGMGKFDVLGISVYEGELQKGEITGRGKKTWVSGAVFEGEFVNGEMNGEGTLSLPSGERYEGSFSDNQQCGTGTLTFANGDVFLGEFRNNKRNGKGTIEFANGDLMQGTFENDMIHGHGKFVSNTGDSFIGYFENGKRHGRGQFAKAKSTLVYDGDWSNEEPVQKPSRICFLQNQLAEEISEDLQDSEIISAKVGSTWSELLSIAILTRQNEVADAESGRILHLLAEPDLKEPILIVRTEKGFGNFNNETLDTEKFTPGSMSSLILKDMTPKLAEDELLPSAKAQLKISK